MRFSLASFSTRAAESSRHLMLIAATCLICLVIGCNSGDDSAADTDASADSDQPAATTPTDQVYKYTLEEINPIGDYGPPYDDRRIELALPKGWHRGTKKPDMVVWYHKFKNNPQLLPQIRITAEDAPEDAPQNATAEDVKEYAQWVDKWVEGQIGDETLIEPVVPLVLGENAFARYVRAGTYKSRPAHRQTLVTTLDGRIYIMETIVYEGDLEKDRNNVLDGYAVAGSLRKPSEDSVSGFPAPGGDE